MRSQIITITISGSNDAPTVFGDVVGDTTEDSGIGATGFLTFIDSDSG
ncbi:MAG: VCBS domain-containing protein, partial [Bryobacterales bacterium]|nr:VCBS domain-containing protein [Bryobacterales bacterium]